MTCHFSLCKWGSWEHNVSLKYTSRGKAYRHMLIFEKVNYSSKVICAETECLNSSSDFFTWKDQIAKCIFPFFFSHMSPLPKPCALFVHQYWIGEICSCGSHWQYSALQGTEKSFGLLESLLLQEMTKKSKTIPLWCSELYSLWLLRLANNCFKPFSQHVILLDVPQVWVEIARTAIYLQQDCQISYNSSWRWITPLCSALRYLLKRRKSPLKLEIFPTV